MHAPLSTGGTLRENLEVGAARGNKTAQRLLIAPPRPLALEYLWVWFMEIRMGAGQAFTGGIAPLTWGEVDAWSRVTRTYPYLHEVRALFSLDLATRSTESKKDSPETSHGR